VPSARPSRTRLATRSVVRCRAEANEEEYLRRGSLALKEWAVACAALQDGRQTVLLRKGGLRDPIFKPKADSFLLFPTAFHNAGDLLQLEAAEAYAQLLDYELGEELPIQVMAELTGCWTTTDPEVLQLTSDFHVWGEGLLHTRLKWKPSQPITVMELRCRKRKTPIRLSMREEYKGCFSWVDLDMDMDGGATEMWEPVMDSSQYEDKQAQLRDKLSLIECSECATAL